MDFLALTTLTIISDCLKALKQKNRQTIDFAVSLNDAKTIALFGDSPDGSDFRNSNRRACQEICRRLKPNWKDLAALNALYRPGPLDGGMIDDFIARHRGEKSAVYQYANERDLNNTYGILVYQGAD